MRNHICEKEGIAGCFNWRHAKASLRHASQASQAASQVGQAIIWQGFNIY